jgi:hypothetical protein
VQGQEEDSGLTSGLPFEVVDGRASDIILNLPRGTHGSGRVKRRKGNAHRCHRRVRLFELVQERREQGREVEPKHCRKGNGQHCRHLVLGEVDASTQAFSWEERPVQNAVDTKKCTRNPCRSKRIHKRGYSELSTPCRHTSESPHYRSKGEERLHSFWPVGWQIGPEDVAPRSPEAKMAPWSTGAGSSTIGRL